MRLVAFSLGLNVLSFLLVPPACAQTRELQPTNIFSVEMKRVSTAEIHLIPEKRLLFIHANDRINSQTLTAFFDVASGEMKNATKLKGFIDLAFSPDFRLYASQSGLTTVAVRTVEGNEVLMEYDVGRDFTLLDLCLVHGGQRLVLCGYNQKARKGQILVVETPSSKVLFDIHHDRPFGDASVHASQNCDRIFVPTPDGGLVYGVNEEFTTPTLIEGKAMKKDVVMSPDGQYVLSGQGDTEVWHLPRSKQPKMLCTLTRDGFTPALVFVPGVPLIAKAQQLDPFVAIRNLNDGKEMGRLMGKGRSR